MGLGQALRFQQRIHLWQAHITWSSFSGERIIIQQALCALGILTIKDFRLDDDDVPLGLFNPRSNGQPFFFD